MKISIVTILVILRSNYIENAFDWFQQSSLDLKTHCQSLNDHYSALIRT